MRTILSYIALMFLALPLLAAQQPLRVAVIGGMTMSGMWQQVAASFEKTYGIPVETVMTGTKQELDAYVRSHTVDLVTMHSSDTMVNLAADGFVEALTPWARNAQMIVVERSNPAGITEAEPLQSALDKIRRSGAPFFIHPSGGTFEVYSELVHTFGFDLDRETIRLTTAKRGFLQEVVQHNGYTLLGVIPFLMQKQRHPFVKGFVFNDPALRRPYLAAIAGQERIGSAQYRNAQQLLHFLTSETVQRFITTFRIEGHEASPVFFPVNH